MNTPHLHLLMNHVPTVGMAIAVVIFLLSFVRKDDGLRRVSLELFFVVALLTLPAYLSGVATQAVLEREGIVSMAAIARHHNAAVFGSIGMLATGGLAWLCLWQLRRLGRAKAVTLVGVGALALLTFAMMAQAATIGGEIRHPEIMADPDAVIDTASAVPWLEAAAIGAWVTSNTWVWPAAEALHFMGLWLLFGVVAVVNLRMLGMLKSASFAAVHRLLPWAVLGLGVNLVTGMLFVLAAPGQYVENVSFFWKIGLLLFAALDLLYLTVFDAPWAVDAGKEAPAAEKILAASALAAWVGVMYFGRMLPFLGNAF